MSAQEQVADASPMLESLGRLFAWHDRTRVVNDRLEAVLRELDGKAWHFERGLTIEGSTLPIPFVLLGATGVFLLAGSAGRWDNDDLMSLIAAASTVGANISCYPSRVHSALVIVGEEDEPRQHFTEDGIGPCWILGETRVREWINGFDERGLSADDIAVLRALADSRLIREEHRIFPPIGWG